MSRKTVVLILLVMTSVNACGDNDAGDTTTTAFDRPTSTSTMTESPTTTSTTTSSTTTSVRIADLPPDLIVVGDWGSGTLPEGAVAGAIQRYADESDLAAILTTGDNFYSDDWEFLMEPYGWAAEDGVPFWITWGNHDVESETRIQAVEEAFDNPPRWAVYEWGSIDVVVLDSNQVMSPQQALFFLDAMSDSDRPTIVAMHHPPYSCAHHGSTTEVVNEVVELLDDDVVLVLSGHDHVYQRFEHNGVAYVVTGGGGASTYELSECPASHPEPLAGESTHHFLTLEQTETAIEVIAIDVNGATIDAFEVPLP